MAWTLALLVTGALGFARADDYFRGDGTAYTLGSTSAGNCNMMAANSDAGANYAAINNPQWDGMKSCGRCAEVSCDDARCTSTSSQVVQILDRCPECKSGDLDLSPSVFKMITGSDPARLSIKWKFVDCPSQGNIKFCLKGGSNNFWTAIQPANFVSGVTSMTVNGKATTMVDSAYYYLLDGNSQVQTDLSSVKVKLTSVSGEVVQDTVSLTAGSCTAGSVQFSSGGSNQGSTVQSEATPPPATPPPTTAAPTTPPPTTVTPTPPPTTAAPTLPPTTVAPTPTTATPTTPASTTETPTPEPTTEVPTPEPTTKEPTPEPTEEPTPAPTPSIEVSDAISAANEKRSISPTPAVIDVTLSPSPPTTPETTPMSTPTPTSAPSPLPAPTSEQSNSSSAFLQDDQSGDTSTPSSTPVPTVTSTPTPTETEASSGIANEASTGTLSPTPSSTSSTPSGGNIQTVNNRSGAADSGLNVPLIVLSAMGAIGVFVLIVVVAMVRKKRIDERKRQADEPVILSSVLTRMYSEADTPAQRTDIAML